MEYKNLGRSGLQVSIVGLGCNNFGMRTDKEQSAAAVDKAIELGVNFFDTADIYGGTRSEEFLGAALGPRRREVIVATKFAGPVGGGVLNKGASRRHMMLAAEDSLRRLGTDWIDLYQVHFPDPDTPLHETMRGMDDLVRSGKVRYIGCSNFPAWQVAESQMIARAEGLAPYISAQNEYNLLDRRVERELVPACNAHGLGVLPYFPLASGFLTGKYKRGEPPPQGTRLQAWGPRGEQWLTDRNFEVLDKLHDVAEQHGRSLLELAIGWLAAQPHVSSVIAGTTSPEQVEANVKAVERPLTPDEIATVDAATKRG